MKVVFWNVDTQKDFMEKNGKLYIMGAESIFTNLHRITKAARRFNLKVVNTADYHTIYSDEISSKPNGSTTFPMHCMFGSEGAEFIAHTNPVQFREHYYIIPYKEDFVLEQEKINNSRNIIIQKDSFNVFTGNPHTNQVVNILKPDSVVVYGVATNVCVDYAVQGLIQRVQDVIVIKDAIKELPLSAPEIIYQRWLRAGVEMITTDNLIALLDKELTKK